MHFLRMAGVAALVVLAACSQAGYSINPPQTVMKSVAAHNIYVNCPAKNQTCWGLPEAFQTGMKGSAFAALLEQYTGSGPNANTLSDSSTVSFPVFRGTAL